MIAGHQTATDVTPAVSFTILLTTYRNNMDKRFIINIQGNEFVLFEGLLNEFFEGNGKTIYTEELPTSTAERPCFKATVSGEKGTFSGHGDADNTNVNGKVAAHKYRMAETRAIARALRWYNNIGMCSTDELGGETLSNAPSQPFQAQTGVTTGSKKCTTCENTFDAPESWKKQCLTCFKNKVPID